MHILPFLLVMPAVAWGLGNLYRDIRRSRKWQLDLNPPVSPGTSGTFSALAGVDFSCHATHIQSEAGNCGVAPGIDFSHLFHFFHH